MRTELPDIDTRTLALTGDIDAQHPPSDAHQIVEKVQGSAYVELPGVGHSPPIGAPDGVTHAIKQHIESPHA